MISCSGCYFAGGLVGVYVEALTLTTKSLFFILRVTVDLKENVHRWWHHRRHSIEVWIWELRNCPQQTKTTRWQSKRILFMIWVEDFQLDATDSIDMSIYVISSQLLFVLQVVWMLCLDLYIHVFFEVFVRRTAHKYIIDSHILFQTGSNLSSCVRRIISRDLLNVSS